MYDSHRWLVMVVACNIIRKRRQNHRIYNSRQSEEPKKNSVGIFEYILASMLKVFLNM